MKTKANAKVVIHSAYSSNSNQITVAGTAHPGDKVTIYDGLRLLGNTTVAEDGSWSLTASVGKTGNHAITAIALDRHDLWNTSSDSTVVNVPAPIQAHVSIAAATDEIVDLAGKSHLFSIAPDTSTRDTSPKLNGSIDRALKSGESIVLYRDGVKIGNAKVTGKAWSFQDHDVVPGAHTYTARVESAGAAAGPVSASFMIYETGMSDSSFLEIPRMLVTDNSLIVDARRLTVDDNLSGELPRRTFMFDIKMSNGESVRVTSVSHDDGLFKLPIDLRALAARDPGAKLVFVEEDWIGNARPGVVSHWFKTIGEHPVSELVHNIDTWMPIATTPHAPTAVASITSITDDIVDTHGVTHRFGIDGGALTADRSPSLHGLIQGTLAQGEVLAVYRDGVKIGEGTLTNASSSTGSAQGTGSVTWSYHDHDLAPGQHTYTARVESASGAGAASNSYALQEAGYDTVGSRTPTRMLVTDDALILDARLFVHREHPDGTYNNMDFSIRYLDSNGQPATVRGIANGDGLVTLPVDLRALIQHDPNTRIVLTAHFTGGGVENEQDPSYWLDYFQTIDVHTASSLIQSLDHWVPLEITASPILGRDSLTQAPAVTDTLDGTQHVDKTLNATAEHATLDLAMLTGKTQAAKVSDVSTIELGGHANTLKLALIDVLNLGEQDLFSHDGKPQLMVNGGATDSIELSDTRVAGIADGAWQQEGTTQVKGVTYGIYEHSTAHVELLVQQGVHFELH